MNKADLYKQLRTLSEQYYATSLDDYDSILTIIEDLLKDQLAIEPQNTELWLRLAMVEHSPPREFPEIIIEYLNKIFEYDPYNIDATIIMAFTYCMLTPHIPDDVFEKLGKLKTENLEKAAMIEIMKAWYYYERNNTHMQEKCLLTAIKYDASFASPYLKLGKLYLRHNQQDDGKRYIKLGLKNIKHVYSDTDTVGDVTDIEEFYNERIKGIHITRYMLDDYMKLL